MKNLTKVQRKSGHELLITRTFDGSARALFEAWTKPDRLKQWWVPKSAGVSLLSCEVDARTDGQYRFELGFPGSSPMTFHGRYIEVVPDARLVWTNEESDDGAVTTVTFEPRDGRTLLTMRDIYPSKEALDHAYAGMEGGMTESFEQLDALLLARG